MVINTRSCSVPRQALHRAYLICTADAGTAVEQIQLSSDIRDLQSLWAEGYSARFEMHYTDYETLRRVPKLSASWYKELIATGRIP
jgi:hypothetical protein